MSTNEISWDQTFLLWIWGESFVNIMQKKVGSFIFCNINEIFFSSTISELSVHRDTIKYIYLCYLFCKPRHVSGSEILGPIYLLYHHLSENILSWIEAAKEWADVQMLFNWEINYSNNWNCPLGSRGIFFFFRCDTIVYLIWLLGMERKC